MNYKWLVFLFLCTTHLSAYTVVTGAPDIEKSFLAQTTNQYQAVLTTNPLASNTYTLKLIGPNTNYNPAPTNAQLLNAIVTVDSYTYVYGWADGLGYGHWADTQLISNHFLDCVGSTVCINALNAAQNDIYQQNYSTPTAPPGGF